MPETLTASRTAPAPRKKSIPPYVRRNYIQCYLMLAVPIIGFVLFSAYPLYWLIEKSWFHWNGITWRYVGWANYLEVVQSPIFHRAIVNTFIFFGKLAIEIPLAFLLALILNKPFRGNPIIRGMLFLPGITSIAVMSVVFFVLLQPYAGFINQFFMSIGILKAPIDWLGSRFYGLLSCIVVSVWQHVGLNMLLILAGLCSISPEYYEAAEIEGITPWKKVWLITIPTIAPYLQMVVMLAIIGTMRVSDLIIVLTGGGPSFDTEVLMSYVFHRFFGMGSGDNVVYNYGLASAGAIITGIIVCIITAIYLILSRKANENVEGK